MESKRKEAQQLLVSCLFFLFASTCDSSSSPIVFSPFFVQSIAFFSLFFWLLQVLLGLLQKNLAVGVLCFFIVLLLVFLFLLIGLFFLEVPR
jgi:hypothetical protein